MKKVICIFLMIPLLAIKVSAQGLSTARSYGETMKQWTATKNDDLREVIEELCNGVKKTRIADEIALDLVPKSGIPRNVSYQLDTYLNSIENVWSRGFSMEFSDFQTVDRNLIEGTTVHETRYAREADKEYVSCRVKVKGAYSYDIYDLICMRGGKITKVSAYEKRGNKIKVDFSDLVNEHSVEVSYGYSSRNPLNVAISTNISYFNIGVEYGQNFSDEQLDFREHTNFATSTLERGKYWYLMATPGVYLRYASIDCGFGNVFAKYNYNYKSVYTSTSTTEKKNYFIMKPKLTIHIPIPFGGNPRDESIYISPHVGYQYVPKCSALNCWEVGIGLRFRFETY